MKDLIKQMSRFWWLFLIQGFVIGIINPRVGIMAAFNFNELIFMGVFLFITFVIKHFNMEGFRESSIFKVLEGIVKLFSYVIPILFFVVINAVEIIFFITSAKGNINYSPVDFLMGQNVVCTVLLIITILANIASFAACLGRTRRIEL